MGFGPAAIHVEGVKGQRDTGVWRPPQVFEVGIPSGEEANQERVDEFMAIEMRGPASTRRVCKKELGGVRGAVEGGVFMHQALEP